MWNWSDGSTLSWHRGLFVINGPLCFHFNTQTQYFFIGIAIFGMMFAKYRLSKYNLESKIL